MQDVMILFRIRHATTLVRTQSASKASRLGILKVWCVLSGATELEVIINHQFQREHCYVEEMCCITS